MPQNPRIHIRILNRSTFITLLIILLIIIFPPAFYADDNPLTGYLNEKALSNYENAIGIIDEWSLKEKDPVIFETNMFRIYELVKYPELIGNAIAAYKNMLNNKTVNDEALRSRINIFLNILYLRKGDMQEAESIRNHLGFIERYKMLGPFRGNGNYNKQFLQETELSKDGPEKSDKDISDTECCDARTDLTGKIDIADLLGKAAESVFYFKSTVYVPADGSYVVRLGKTGYTDLWIDGSNVFSDRLKHGFSYDQYCIQVSLTRGKHVLLLKLGASDSGLEFALRLTDAEGNPVNNVHNELHGGTSIAKCKVENISFFNALEKLIQIKNMNMQIAFNAGYLYYISGINSQEEEEAKTLFSQVKNSGLRSASCYYLGLLAGEGKSENYFNESVKTFKRNVEAINGIAEIKVKSNLLSEARKLSETIRDINPQSFYINKINAGIFELAGWDHEALKEANAPRNRINSSGYEIKASVYLKNKQYKEAGDMYKHLYEMDRFNSEYPDDLLECYFKAGRYNEARSFLAKCADLYPNNVLLRLKHAKLMENINGTVSALPYLLSARKISPCNKDVLVQIALLYHKLNKKELTLLYLNSALQQDPGNKWISGYIYYLKCSESRALHPTQPKGGSKGILPKHTDNISRVTIGNKADSQQYEIKNSYKDINAKSPLRGGLGGNAALANMEQAIFNSMLAGNQTDLYNNVEKLLLAFPADPKTIIYYPEIGRLAGAVGSKRCIQTIQKVISLVNNIANPAHRNICILLLKLELEKLLYQTDKPEAAKLSDEFFPVRKWLLSGPYKKYGPADIDYPFMPEIIKNLNDSDIKKKEVTIQNAKGNLEFGKYFYPGAGVVYAAATIPCAGSVKIRIYSDSQYTLFINGKETIRNQKDGIFRSCRILKVQDSVKMNLLFKMYLENCRSSLRVLITDENDRPVNTVLDASEFVFSDFTYSEEMDFPYNYFMDRYKDNKSGRNNEAFYLGSYFRNLQSSEAVNYYRETVTPDNNNPAKSIYLAEYLFDLSYGNKESARYLESMEIMNHLHEKYGTAFGLNLSMEHASHLLDAGYEKEFEIEINSLKANYPYANEPLMHLASYYKDRDVFKSIGIYKKIISEQRFKAAFKALIDIYKNMGRYNDIISLLETSDAEKYFRKELIQAYINAQDYENAKKTVFQGLTEKDDPYYNIKLGEINYIKGFDPAMYWQKALSINSSNVSLREYLNYLETGEISDTALENIAYSESGNENILSGIKDLRDFAAWYSGLLKGTYEIDKAYLPRFKGTTQDEQIKEVYEYVSRNIELKGRKLFSPGNANDTLYKKKGSIENKTILASALFAELGIRSYIAFAGPENFVDESGFFPEKFTGNILLYVPLDVNNGIWMDFSDADSAGNTANGSLAGRDAVVIIKTSYEIKKIAK